MSPVPPSTPLPPPGAGKVGGARPAKGIGKLSNGMLMKSVPTVNLLGKTVDAEQASVLFGGLRKLAKQEQKKEKTAAKDIAAKKPEEEKRLIKEVASVDDEARGMAKRNREFKAPILVKLFTSLRPTDTPADILRKVQNLYSDPTLADEALAFLERVATDNNLKTKIHKARNRLNRRYEREIIAGRNIEGPVYELRTKHPEVKQKPNALRDLYRAITGKIHTAIELFNYFFGKFPFDHQVFIYGFLFSAFGADLKSKASSIPKAQLTKLVKDVRKVQAIFGVYRFFKSALKAIKAAFERYHIPYPPGR